MFAGNLHPYLYSYLHSSSSWTFLALGDFNHLSLRKVLPGYKEQIFTTTRGDETLCQCLCVMPRASHTVVRAPLGESDHDTVFLVLKYCQRLKTVKPCKIIRQCSPQNMDGLDDCLLTTHWGIFKEANDDLDSFTDVVTSNITFVIKSVTIYGNNKPCSSKDIKELCKRNNIAFKSGDKDFYKACKYEL